MSASKAALNSAVGPFIGKDEYHDLLGITTFAGDPTSSLTPGHIGQFCHDTSNDDLYWAHGATSADWKIMAT